jgi:hypothetical protein
MKQIFSFVLLSVVFTSCEKEHPTGNPLPEQMQYTNLGDAEVSYGHSKSIDINKDGKADFLFSTLLVGDPILQRDKLQFYAYSKIETYLMNDENSQSLVLSKGDLISIQPAGYEWYEISGILLAEKITPVTGAIFWEGLWKDASHRFLPVMVKANGLRQTGWIELSFNKTAEKIILHKAAIRLEAEKDCKAGL